MKFISIILLSCFMFLAVHPVVYKVYTLTQHHSSCCGAKCCNTGKQCNDNMAATCNTCTGCLMCLGNYIHEPACKFELVAETRAFGPSVTHKLLSDYCSNFFRPPQVV